MIGHTAGPVQAASAHGDVDGGGDEPQRLVLETAVPLATSTHDTFTVITPCGEKASTGLQ